ncbi:MAG: hypothetical protein QM756_21205 [Polyangiaceae bacterium]
MVVATGDDTEARRGAVAQKSDASRGGVERRLRSLIDLTGPIALGAGVGLIGSGLLRRRKLEDLVGSGVSLAVASVPEGLPLLATAAQLAAASRLTKQGALVRNIAQHRGARARRRHLSRQNRHAHRGSHRARVGQRWAVAARIHALGASERHVLGAALRASDLTAAVADPTDAALVKAAAEIQVRSDEGCPAWHKQSDLPYEAGRGFSASVGQANDLALLSVKGAPEIVLRFTSEWQRGDERVPIDVATAAALHQHASDLGRQGYRLLAVAERRLLPGEEVDARSPTGLEFLGFRRLPRRRAAERAPRRRGSRAHVGARRDGDRRPPQHRARRSRRGWLARWP